TVKDVTSCDGSFAQNVKTFLLNNKVDVIFLVARWKLYATGWILNGRLMKPNGYVSDNETIGIDEESSTKVLLKALKESLLFLTQEVDSSINFLLPTPVLPKIIEKYTLESKNVLTQKDYIKQRSLIVDYIESLALNSKFNIMDPLELLCPGKECILFRNSQRIYLDDNHLSPRESTMLLPLFEKVLLQN
ncbi:MAG: hypothetical protein KAI17_10775, partial [Thiotrichaceae bacterium]|nr:hypothetical protein [Thiotrichaceae bacterium]